MDTHEHDDRYTLVVADGEVNQLRFDFALTLLVNAPPHDDGFLARISGPCVLTASDGVSTSLDPEGDPSLMAPALRLSRLGVTRTDCFKDGRLEIEFADGTVLAVPPDPRYEPWEIAGPSGQLIVSMPGGGLG